VPCRVHATLKSRNTLCEYKRITKTEAAAFVERDSTALLPYHTITCSQHPESTACPLFSLSLPLSLFSSEEIRKHTSGLQNIMHEWNFLAFNKTRFLFVEACVTWIVLYKNLRYNDFETVKVLEVLENSGSFNKKAYFMIPGKQENHIFNI
jgi:hypothetical protein